MLLHRPALPLAAVVALSAFLLGGCTPEPSPPPTPTPAFATDAEAFAAAEEVYRAYNAAGNQRRSGDKAQQQQDYLTGLALEGSIDGQNFLREHGMRLSGSVLVIQFTGQSTGPSRSSPIHAFVCLDISGARTLDEKGNDITPAERPAVIAQQVTFVQDDAELRISEEAEGDAKACASS